MPSPSGGMPLRGHSIRTKQEQSSPSPIHAPRVRCPSLPGHGLHTVESPRLRSDVRVGQSKIPFRRDGRDDRIPVFEIGGPFQTIPKLRFSGELEVKRPRAIQRRDEELAATKRVILGT